MADRRLLILLPGKQIFGQERALINLGLLFRENGVQCTFLVHEKWGRDIIGRYLSELGFEVAPMPFGTIWSVRLLLAAPRLIIENLKALFATTARLREILQADNIDGLLLGNISFSAYLLPALRSSDVAVIYRHGDAPPNSGVLLRNISKWVFNRADIHVANCIYIARTLAQQTPSIVPEVIYNFPVQCRGALEGKNKGGAVLAAGGVRRLVFLGQISEHKGIHIVLSAFEVLARRYNDLVLHIAGAPPGVLDVGHDPNVARIAEMKRVWGDRIIFMGHVEDVSTVLVPGSLHLCPSVWEEPSPNVIFEAKACGIPTVGFARGGIPELIDHLRNGYLCEEQSFEALVAGISYFLEDASRYNMACRGARESLNDEFSYTIYESKWLSIVRQGIDALQVSDSSSVG